MKMMKKMKSHGLCLLLVLVQIMLILAATNSQDAAALVGLGDQWKNKPSNWNGPDPCGDRWVGISCVNNSRVTSITLSSLGIEGTLTGDIQSLTELQALDLSYNTGLTGQIPASIGSLSKLENLILVGCSFSGEIPAEIGSLKLLTFLSLNSNKFSGRIPPTIGNLAKLYWLDLANNLLTGGIPISDGINPGLDMLTHTKHFHFGINKLSGAIPDQLFSSNMRLIHLLLDNNNLSGEIPSTLGLVQTLEVVRLDRNQLTGPVPSNINNLTNVAEMHLSNNELIGPLPNLTGMNSLSYLDMSNNTFDPSDVPTWFSTLPSLTTLVLEHLTIRGEIPTTLFSFPPLQTARLRNNKLNGTLNIGTHFSSQLELVDVQDNNIEELTAGGGYKNQLILIGNPVCEHGGIDPQYCQVSQQSIKPYSTQPENCIQDPCLIDQSMSPHCICAYPYSGTLVFRAPSFSSLANSTYFGILEDEMMDSFRKNQLPVDSVSLNNITTDSKDYLNMYLQVFPSGKLRFDQSDVSSIGFILSNQTFKPNKTLFGPYSFIGAQYTAFPVTSTGGKSSNSKTAIIGAAVGAVVIAMILIMLFVFLVQRKKKTRNAVEHGQPFDSWVVTKRSGDAPQLKGARSFSYEELKKCTNNFAESNDIGTGGYGKVYKGTLANGQLVAIKRAQQGSMQGGLEFKTEIEMLSRVHHKNLVSLIGFCFDQGEQMLVYEYVTNGSLKESLTGKSGVQLDWRRRLRVALGAAKGLAYLHDLADPPIVHRDIKSGNILLDNHLNAKVSDFGLSKPLGDNGKDHVTTQVKGTMGYLDPEYYMSQQLTEKSDVYSYGVLLLELLTARKPIERGRYVVREVRSMMDKAKDLYGLDQLLDPILISSSLGGFDKFVDLALSCVQEEGANRPKMSQVVQELENIMVLAGMNPIMEAGSTSSSYEVTTSKSGDSHHPYKIDAFDYSGGAPSVKLEAK